MHKVIVAIFVAAGCLTSVACEPAGVGNDAASNAPVEPTVTPPPVEPQGPAAFEAQFVFDVREGASPKLPANSPLKLAPQDDGSINISGSAPKAAASGRTQGAFFTITEENEAQFSGKKVSVRVLARSTDSATASAKIAYSTAEVGNSGWKEFGLTDQYAEYTFEYNVPPMVDGKKDYIGIVPVDGSVDVLAVGVDVL